MKKTIISREFILSACKDIVIQSGMSALNMRDVAKKCGVAVGSVYNYFPSKEDLVIATIESIWKEIMHYENSMDSQLSFLDTVMNLFNNVQRGSRKYPLFLIIHFMSFMDVDKKKGREVMSRFFEEIEEGLLESLNHDQSINSSVFSEEFSKHNFVKFVFSNIITLIINQTTSCDFLTAVIKRTIYD